MQADLKVLSARLLEVRKTLGFKQKEFAQELEISQSSYCDIEIGNMKPRFELLFNLSLKFDVNLRYLLHGQGEMFEKQGGGAIHLDSENIVQNWEWVSGFLKYYEKSPVFRYGMMSLFYKYMHENGAVVDREVLDSDKAKPNREQNIGGD